MGQQELVIIALGIIVVGFAMYTGGNMYDRVMRPRHADLLWNHAVHVAGEATTWRSKGSSFLGGGGDYANFKPNGLSTSPLIKGTMQGLIRITHASKDSLEITAVSRDIESIGVRVHVSGTDIVKTTIAYDGSITLSRP